MINELAVIIASGFSIGIIGSFHCVGMCGPIALSLPVHQYSNSKKILAIFLYNIGRASTYALMGLIFGILGQSFQLFKIQQYTSIVAGVFILSILLFSSLSQFNISFISSFSLKIKNKLGTLLKRDKTIPSYFAIGLVNGFLPCGLVYVAIATAVAAGTMLKSSLLMFAFGLGTIPVMAFTMYLGKFISISFKNKLNKLTPYIIGVVAILLILRGLNLGIPYISPKQVGQHKTCCHKS